VEQSYNTTERTAIRAGRASANFSEDFHIRHLPVGLREHFGLPKNALIADFCDKHLEVNKGPQYKLAVSLAMLFNDCVSRTSKVWRLQTLRGGMHIRV
jgi:hypothetical protein